MKINAALLTLAKSKASKSPSKFKISAIAFDAKGDILGHTTNSYNSDLCWDLNLGRKGTGRHAERILIARYGRLIKTILICRISKTGKLLPIEPCAVCQKVANKYGIEIVSVKA
jgi:cytidine deaminase